MASIVSGPRQGLDWASCLGLVWSSSGPPVWASCLGLDWASHLGLVWSLSGLCLGLVSGPHVWASCLGLDWASCLGLDWASTGPRLRLVSGPRLGLVCASSSFSHSTSYQPCVCQDGLCIIAEGGYLKPLTSSLTLINLKAT